MQEKPAAWLGVNYVVMSEDRQRQASPVDVSFSCMIINNVLVTVKISLLDRKSFFLIKILYLFISQTEITSRQRGRQREEEAGPLLSREPDAGLDPRTLGS